MTSTSDSMHGDARRTDTRARILEVSGTLFREKGYAATSIQNIADELGVTKAALYYHFAAKEDILVALKQPVLDAITALLDEPFDYRSAEGRRAFIEAMVATLANCGPDIASLMTDAQAQFEVRSALVQTDVAAKTTGILAAGLCDSDDPADASPAAVLRVGAMIGALHGAFDAWIAMSPPGAPLDPPTQQAIVNAALGALESGS